ncbi:MAG: phosphotransferase [Rhodobiaceae bacterium]|nr:phosphotransferase [Rhodobiaceae bacterium]MCC0016555.1 phosphotransferase [Rhodobiaceae bacterium]MCC0042389.1 phosphotransferase [Rhodobiaceae bacterium]
MAGQNDSFDFDALPHERQLEILADISVAALDSFPLPSGCSVDLINLSENATYKVEAPDGTRWALRIHRDGYHSDVAIASEIAWLVDLRRKNVVTTPVPVPGHDGEVIQKVPHAALPRPRNVVVYEWESGSEPGVNEDLRKPFEVLGEVTARMHQHVRSWQRPTWFERLTWNFETSLGDTPHWGRWRDGMGMDAAKEKLFGETVDLIGKRLAAFGQSGDRFGLIHCDLRLANLLVDGSEVKVIDFDDCGFSWFMYDAATPVSFYEHLPEVPDLIRHWLIGYRRVIDLPQADEDEIPTFVMLRRLLLVAWIGSHSETELAQSMGVEYTAQTVDLCRKYLKDFG